jgi:hypothetical protein
MSQRAIELFQYCEPVIACADNRDFMRGLAAPRPPRRSRNPRVGSSPVDYLRFIQLPASCTAALQILVLTESLPVLS